MSRVTCDHVPGPLKTQIKRGPGVEARNHYMSEQPFPNAHTIHIITASYSLQGCTPGLKLITYWFKSQLSAGNLSDGIIPEVITHCAPYVVVADLHTSAGIIASLKSGISLGASGTTHSNIFSMCAVGGSKCWNSAVSETGLIPMTLDIRQPDLTSTIGESSCQGNSTCICT